MAEDDTYLKELEMAQRKRKEVLPSVEPDRGFDLLSFPPYYIQAL